jgi:deoxyribose-phosphate aldolase
MADAKHDAPTGPVEDAETLTTEELAALIDHTDLKPVTSTARIEALSAEALTWGFASVCVHPVHVGLVARLLRASPVRVCTVVGFPLGASRTPVKAFETRTAVGEGAEEIDMVGDIGALMEGDTGRFSADVGAVVEAADGRLVKVILETGYFSDEAIALGCRLCRDAGAGYVKTSTGFGPGGATVDHVRLMRETVGNGVGVKASGGIGDHRRALAMVRAGASRLGASAGVAIVEGLREEKSGGV